MFSIRHRLHLLLLIAVVGHAQNSPSLRTLDNVLQILISEEPQYQGVSDLINNSKLYFGAVLRIAESQSPDKNGYQELDRWAKEKLKTLMPLVERGEAYRYTYYNKILEAPRLDPTIRAMNKEYLGILADLKGDPRMGLNPPLYKHPDAQREVGELLRSRFSTGDRSINPDIYNYELNRRTFRYMEQSDYSKPAPNQFEARLKDIKDRLKRLQTETYRKFLIAKSRNLNIHVAPVTNLNDAWGVERDEISKITAEEIAKLQIEADVDKWGDTVFFFKRQSPEGERVFSFGHSESKGYWGSLSRINDRDVLVGEEKFLGKMETDFIRGESNEEDMHLALLKKQLKLCQELNRNLDKANQARDLPRIANDGIAKLSDFNQRPNASEFHWIHSHGLAEYRGETTHYNRLMNGIIWEGRSRSVDQGADYWQIRDEEAARNGKAYVQSELSTVNPGLGGDAKRLTLKSLSRVGRAIQGIKNLAFPPDMSSIFNDHGIGNTSEKDIEKKKKKLLFDIRRASDDSGVSQFRLPAQESFNNNSGTSVQITPNQKDHSVFLKGRVPAKVQNGRHYLVTPRNHLATWAKVFDEKGQEIPVSEWELKIDKASGHHWIDFKDKTKAPKRVVSEVGFSAANIAPLSSAERAELLVNNLDKFLKLINEVDSYGFKVLANSLRDMHLQALAQKTSLSIDEVRQAFVNTSLYSYEPEASPARSEGGTYPLETFRGFLKEGMLCGQCDSGNQFFAAFMSRYFDDKPSITVSTDSVFQTGSKANIIRLSDAHLVTKFAVNGRVALVVDATATETEKDYRKRKPNNKIKGDVIYSDDQNSRIHVKNKKSTTVSVEELRRFHSELKSAQNKVNEVLDVKNNIPTKQLREAMNLSNPLGRSLIYTTHLNKFLSQSPTPESLRDLAQNIGVSNPDKQGLADVMGHIASQSNDLSLKELSALDQASVIQKNLLRKMPLLESSRLRQQLRNLSNVLSSGSALVSEAAHKDYVQSQQAMLNGSGKCAKELRAEALTSN